MRHVGSVAALLAVLCAVPSFSAPGDKVGAEFQVNTYTTTRQSSPSVAAQPNGGFVVAWSSSPQDGSGYGVFGQRFDKMGAPAGTEFQVNTYTPSAQYSASLAAQPNGGFVVAWSSSSRDGSGSGVFGQRFDSAGAPAGTEFQVNTYTTNYQRAPFVAAQPDGGFVVTWLSVLQDGSQSGVFGQRFESTGAPAGTEFQVNTYTTSDQDVPSVAAQPDGGFVVAWASYLQDGYGDGVFGQRFDSTGTPAGTEFQVNTYTTSYQAPPSVAAQPDGGFVVAWTSVLQDGSGYGVFGQRFESTGAPAGAEFQVNAYTTSHQGIPSVAAQPDGGFVVAWLSYLQDGSTFGVFGQRFDSAGAPAGTEFQVNTYTTSYQGTPSVAAQPDSGFVVAWTSDAQDSDNAGVFGQRFDSNFACGATPLLACPASTKGQLQLRDNTDDSRDQVKWKFKGGPALMQSDFGDPTTSTGYSLCIYEDTALVLELNVPPGSLWAATGTKGYQYKDSTGTNDGVNKVKLRGGDAGKSKMQLKGKGSNLPTTPTLPFGMSSTIRAQLQGNNACYETSFSGAQFIKNEAGKFKAKF